MPAFDEAWITIIKAYDNLGPNVKGGVARPYQSPADKPSNPNARWAYTCGWGHWMSESEQKEGILIDGQLINAMKHGLTTAQADALLAKDLRPKIIEVESALLEPTVSEFGAFLDIVFNAGSEALHGTPARCHNEGDKVGAAMAMLLYRKAQGVGLLGLWRRRLTDAVYYLSGNVIVANNQATEDAAHKKLEELTKKEIPKPLGLK